MAEALPPRDFVVFDTETTGIPPGARLVEIGALKVRGKNVVERFESLVYPECPIPAASTEVHGITDQDVADAPTAREVLPGFLDWVDRRPLLGHNVAFDASMLATECLRLGLQPPANPTYCTLRAARKLLPQMRSHSLESLACELGLPGAPHHRAAEDALHTLHLYWHLERLGGRSFRRSTLGRGRTVDTHAPDPARIPRRRRMLLEAADLEAPVDLEYALPDRRVIPARVTPRFFYERRGGVVMEALCHQSCFYKSYRLDRILAAHPCPDAAPAQVRRLSRPQQPRERGRIR